MLKWVLTGGPALALTIVCNIAAANTTYTLDGGFDTGSFSGYFTLDGDHDTVVSYSMTTSTNLPYYLGHTYGDPHANSSSAYVSSALYGPKITMDDIYTVGSGFVIDKQFTYYDGIAVETLLDNGNFVSDRVSYYSNITPALPVPDTATWEMMILGGGLVGAALRQRKRAAATLA